MLSVRTTPHAVGIDRSAVVAAQPADPGPGSVSTWAMLIKRVYEVDPLECPHCSGEMKVISFIERNQRQAGQQRSRMVKTSSNQQPRPGDSAGPR